MMGVTWAVRLDRFPSIIPDHSSLSARMLSSLGSGSSSAAHLLLLMEIIIAQANSSSVTVTVTLNICL